MVGEYNRAGVQFQYPDSWRITDDLVDESSRVVSLESPGGGFWTVQIFPADVEPWNAAGEVVEALRADYETLETEEVTEVIGDRELVGYDMNFYCLDFVIAARTRSVKIDRQTYVFLYQAEDRDFDNLEPVFRAMITSLVRGTG